MEGEAGFKLANAERVLDKSGLANEVILAYPADLTFADDVHGVHSAIVFRAPSTDRNAWLIIIGFFTKRSSNSGMLLR
jgi:hypothetical protein